MLVKIKVLICSVVCWENEIEVYQCLKRIVRTLIAQEIKFTFKLCGYQPCACEA